MNIKQIFSFILIFSIVLGTFPKASLAQEGIELIPKDSSLNTSPETNNGADQTQEEVAKLPSSALAESNEPSPIPVPSFSEGSSFPSAQYIGPVIIRGLAKRSFRANERINVIVDNVKGQQVEVKVTNNEGAKVEFEEFTIDEDSRKTVVIKPPSHLRPGKYTIELSTGGQTQKQDFTWGVLAINTNKSIYTPSETAKLAMAVLNEAGEMVCDASLNLKIKNEKLKIEEELSTENGKIKVNDSCQKKEVTITPDYEADYKIGREIGKYDMSLTAETKNGTYSITDSFEVRSEVPFNVERRTATRIFPPLPYPVDLEITANQDFEGTIAELVPGSFAVDPSSTSDYSFEEVQTTSQEAAEGVLGVTTAKLGKPFEDSAPISLEFGQHLRDGQEKDFYAKFNLAGHDGVDFDVPIGTPILSIDDGEVTLAGSGAYGLTAVVKHSWGQSYYGHLSQLEVKVGDEVKKGDVIALSGNTGYTTGPHLHFGIKLAEPDMQNGYYGKTDPLPVLGIQSNLDPANQLKLITWKVKVKKGDKFNLGYFYKAPNISPEFYKLGPLRFYEEDQKIFEEARQWQVAVDQDGGGTNTVSPTTGQINATGQTYTFTYTTGESVATGSGSITIQEPSSDDWTVPQTSNSGAAGYTVFGSGTGTPGEILDNADSNTNWNFVGTNACSGAAPTVDTAVTTEGTGDLKCINGNVAAGRGFYKSISSTDWTNYTTVGVWLRTSSAIGTTSHIRFSYDDTAALASPIANISMSTGTGVNNWTWETFTLTGTRNAIVSFGITYGHATALDSVTVWADYFLIGPGSPTVSGTSPWKITVPIITIPASTGTILVTYGSGGGAGGVTNSATEGVHTFTTQSKIATNPTNSLANISSQPTVTLSPSGPTLDQLMRHGKWLDAGTENGFTF